MKQTNNAIKFLMAQYRAIFNNAYFKGLASAALVTVAMAAGQAQAQTPSDLANALSGTTAQSPAEVFDVTSNDSTVSGASGGYIKGITVKSGTLSFKEQTAHVRTNGVVEVQSGATLSLSGSSGAVAGLIGTFDDSFDDNPNSTLSVDGGTVTVNKSQIQMNRVELNNATVTIGTAIGDNSNSGWKDLAMINAEVAWNADKTAIVEGTGVFSVTGAADKVLTLDSGSQILAAQFDLDGGKIVMKSQSGDDSGSIIRAYTEGNLSVINLNGSTIEANTGKDNHLAGRTININGGTIDIKDNAGLHISGTLDSSKDKITEAQQSGTINFTSGSLTIGSNGSLTVEGLTNKKGTTFNVSQDAQLSGTGSVELGEKAHLNIDQSILNSFVKPGTDGSTGNGGKINFAKAGSQVTIDSTELVDLSSYGFGSGANADFDVTGKSVTGKIIGDKLAITKATSGTLTSGTNAIKVEADELTLGSDTAESKLSTIQGTVLTQLTAHDKLTLAGSGDKFTIDSGDMFLTNRNADKAAVIDGAELAFDHGRINIKGAWESASDITFTGGSGTSNANIFFGNASGVTTSLTLTGTIKNDKTTNTWGGIRAGATTAESTLDITKATLASTGTSGNMVSFIADKNGVVKVTGEQVTSILKAEDNTKGFTLAVTSGGKLDIQGDFAANFDDFIKGTSNGGTDANKITIGGTAGGVSGSIIANKATLTGSGDLNLQAAQSDDVTLELAELDITNTTTSANDVTIKSGSIQVTNKLIRDFYHY